MFLKTSRHVETMLAMDRFYNFSGTLLFVVLVSSVIWSTEAAPKSSNEEIIKALKEVFLESKDDFIIAQDIEKYFPFTKLIDVNKEERENEFEDINNYALAWNICSRQGRSC